jgi:hypothetical protein
LETSEPWIRVSKPEMVIMMLDRHLKELSEPLSLQIDGTFSCHPETFCDGIFFLDFFVFHFFVKKIFFRQKNIFSSKLFSTEFDRNLFFYS